MTDPHRDYPTPSETIAALEARIDKLELVCAQKSARCTEAVRDMSLANAESARLRELLQELTWSSWQLSGDLKNRIKAELAKGE